MEKLECEIWEESSDSQLLVKQICAKVLVGLEQLHKSQVVHRDLKPSNVLITADGDVKLADFGTASASDEFYSPAAGEKIRSIKKMMS